MDKLYELNKQDHSKLINSLRIGDWYIHYNNVPIYCNDKGKQALAIIGDFFHIQSPELTGSDIVKELLDLQSFNAILDYSKYLLGRFVIFYFGSDHSVKIIPDPTATIPICYTSQAGEIVVSSSTHLLREKFGFSLSKTSLKIKNGAANQQPLPYNLTMFDEVKQVIPNHYFDSNTAHMERFYPVALPNSQTLDYAVDQTIKVIDNVLPFIVSKKKLSLPLTAGIDSRTVLAFLKKYIDQIPSYTFYSPGDTADLETAQNIAKEMNFRHKALKRKSLNNQEISFFKDKLDGNHNIRILNNGYTLNETAFKDRSFLAGDVIPLAKSNFGKNLPEKLATSSYLVTKTHNYTRENKKYIKNWLQDVREQNYISIFDLFFWEYRFGRWLPNNADNYDIWSDPFYLFNNRYLIELWLSVPREQRTKYSFHEEIIEKKWPELLEIPVNPGKKYKNKIFSNQYLFYLGSFGKYYLERLRRHDNSNRTWFSLIQLGIVFWMLLATIKLYERFVKKITSFWISISHISIHYKIQYTSPSLTFRI